MKFNKRVKKLENEINADLIIIHFENGEVMKITNEELLGLMCKLRDDQKVFPSKPISHNYGGSLIELIYTVQSGCYKKEDEEGED